MPLLTSEYQIYEFARVARKKRQISVREKSADPDSKCERLLFRIKSGEPDSELQYQLNVGLLIIITN